ncbi:MAG: ANTAR domain-containing response regulator, partial [Rhodopila sp.]
MKVLLADDDAERAGAVARVLAADEGLAVVRLPPGDQLVEAVATLAPDVVLVDMARPDRDALDGIRQVAAVNARPVVLFVDEDDPTFMEEAINAGVSSYNAI